MAIFTFQEKVEFIKSRIGHAFELTDDTDPRLLRNLDQKESHGGYPVIIITSKDYMRGVDFRSEKQGVFLIIDKSFNC